MISDRGPKEEQILSETALEIELSEINTFYFGNADLYLPHGKPWKSIALEYGTAEGFF